MVSWWVLVLQIEEDILSSDLLHVHYFVFRLCPIIDNFLSLLSYLLFCPDLILWILLFFLKLVLLYAFLSSSTPDRSVESLDLNFSVRFCDFFVLLAVKSSRVQGWAVDVLVFILIVFIKHLLQCEDINMRTHFHF
jgi:hypothetical protein